MEPITQLLQQIEQEESRAPDELLPLLYDELRRLAMQKLAFESPGLTLQATALVHEAYVRLMDVKRTQQWNSRHHFFAAAAEAMRRILIENARRRASRKRGGGYHRNDMALDDCEAPAVSEELLLLDAALDRLAAHDTPSAELVKLRYFAGMTNVEAAAILGVSPRKADFMWSYARAWLRREMER